MVDKQGVDGEFRELALFAGAGGGILGGKLLGWRTMYAVERDAYCASVLAIRQNEGVLPPFPIWSDVESFDGRICRGIIDVISGGFPCQNISAAGKGEGIDGPKSGLWREFKRIICEVQPRYVFVENSPIITSRGLGRVLGDLAECGYNARWGVFSAAASGAWHLRKRMFIVASNNNGAWKQQRERYVEEFRRRTSNSIKDATDIDGEFQQSTKERPEEHRWSTDSIKEDANVKSNRLSQSIRRSNTIDDKAWRPSSWWATEPNLVRVVHGLDHRLDRIRSLGNGQVPCVVARAWKYLSRGM